MLIIRSKKVMTGTEHPFAKVCRAVLKEKYPDKAAPDDSPLTVSGIPEDVLSEASKRYYAGKVLIIGPRVWVSPASTAPKQKKAYTFRYV
jgi:hypothetical protein